MANAPGGWIDVNAQAWELSRTARLPARWAAQFQKRFQEKKRRDSFAANVWLRDLSERMSAYRVPLNATDDDLRRIAAEAACGAIDVTRLQPFGTVTGGRVAMSQYCKRWGIEAPAPEIEDRPAIARMTCPDWWLRKLRQVHARGLEGEAVRVGFVHRRADCYVSRESFERRQQQKRRAAAMLQSTVVENDEGQAYTLADLAAVSVANPAIRRGELMLRLAGFEACARAAGDVAEFVTLTCPSAYGGYSQLLSTSSKLLQQSADNQTTMASGFTSAVNKAYDNASAAASGTIDNRTIMVLGVAAAAVAAVVVFKKG